MDETAIKENAAPDFMEHGEAPETLFYKAVGNRKLRLLCVKPAGWKQTDRRTAFLWIHGGGWCNGDPERFLPHCRYFSSRGAVTFSVEYRLVQYENDAIKGPLYVEDCLKDCKTAVRYIRKNAETLGIDPERVAVAGDSSGGHLACCLGTIGAYDDENGGTGISAVPDVIVSCNGIADMALNWKQLLPDGGDSSLSQVDLWLAKHRKAETLSPVYHIRPNQPPMLLQHGLQDKTVPPEETMRFYELYRNSGNQTKLLLYPDCKHAFILFHYTAATDIVMRAIYDIDAFLTEKRFLQRKSGETPPGATL